MRIFVYEHVTGGGLAGRPLPRVLACEGLAMRSALIEDLVAIGRHEIVTTMDDRVACTAPRGVQVITVAGGQSGRAGSAAIDAVIEGADAVWLIAPETGRCLERLTAGIERRGKTVLGTGAAAVRRAADKSRLPRRLARLGIPHPETSLIDLTTDTRALARRLGYPVVVKPARGAGCCGVSLARTARELDEAVDAADRARGGPLLMQRYVRGRAASVSLLADGRRAVPLAVNAQRVIASSGFSYRGGQTPFDHPLAAAAAAAASRTCAAIPGLRGYVGVDLVLTEAGPVVIEVNPRLTMSYLGVRAVLEENVAALAIAACHGRLPDRAVACRRARFSASGRIRPS